MSKNIHSKRHLQLKATVPLGSLDQSQESGFTYYCRVLEYVPWLYEAGIHVLTCTAINLSEDYYFSY